MKKIIASTIISCMFFTSLPVVYADGDELISTDKYSINTSIMCIYGIPYETTAEKFKENINISKIGATVTVTDIDGEVKDGIIEDGDRLTVEAGGEEYEYYLKTGIDGVSYSDSFNYRNYEEYKKVQNAINKTGKNNIYAPEDNILATITEVEGDRVLKIAPKPIKIGMNQYNRFNFIQFEEISDKAVVEYDVWQKDLSRDSIWVYVNAVYSGVPEKAETGYALWGSRISDRGTLMRDDMGKARWISLDGKPLFMEDESVYHVRQVLDFNGDIETYINGVQAEVTNEKVTENLSKSMGNISGITSIGYGVYLDTNGDWTNNSEGYGAMWDNVRVYDPVKYAEFYIDLLPEKGETAELSVYENTKKARAVIDDLTTNVLDESEVSNLDKLLFWEEQFASVKVNSEKYDVDNEERTVKGILKGETVSEFFDNLIKVEGYSYEIIGKEENDEVLTGDVLKVTDFINRTEEYSLSVEKGINVKGYSLNGSEISDIPYNTPVEEFLKNILRAESTNVKVYKGLTENTYVIKDGNTLKVTFKNGDVEEYLLKVMPGSVTAELSGVDGISVDSKNQVILGVEKGITVEELKRKLHVSDRGSLKIYREDGTEMIMGTITGTEIVKVFPEDQQPGTEFDIYTISCNLTFMEGESEIVTIKDEGFSYTETIYESGSAVEPGYNDITTIYFTSGYGTFTYTVPESREYNVYIYTSYHSSNSPFPATITYKGGKKDVMVPQNEKSGWKLVGTYAFTEGDNVKVECGKGMARLSAVKFEEWGNISEITQMEAVSGDISFNLKEGINSILKDNVKFNITADAELKKDDIRIISENGNVIDFEFNEENGEYFVTPIYSLRDNITYTLIVESDKLSKGYTYVLKNDEKCTAISEILFCDKEGKYLTSAAKAEVCDVNLKIKNPSSEMVSAKLVICYYSENGKADSIVMEDVEIGSGEILNINKQIDIKNPSENGKTKVFLWKNDFEPFGNVYYK